ncbi:MAG: DNA-binding Lrp family transcriptional regulator [Saprospiraceae bacterium]|jgi:DNA-binding Lrp family transcriptional regulator|tara:strand:- start:188 stop:655 length:468 start_codon:yes stop_codon:yes gene_type:complete
MSEIIDAIDRRIIHKLQQNGKETMKEIADSLGMSTTPVYERIKKLEREAYIEGYTAIVNKEKMGFQLVVFCTVTLESHHTDFIEQFESDIKSLPEVMECYHIAGMFDYLLKIYATDMADYQKFITQKLAAISNIGRVQSSFMMTEVKNEKVMPLR